MIYFYFLLAVLCFLGEDSAQLTLDSVCWFWLGELLTLQVVSIGLCVLQFDYSQCSCNLKMED